MTIKRQLHFAWWCAVALLAAFALGVIAIRRGEPINAAWLIVAAVCSYAVGYRFYSKFLATKVLVLDSRRATPAERLEDGRDFVPTNKWIVFGHHFAAIAGPGPLIGPVLAAQFGYLPGTLWIIIGAVVGGCVQDFVILLFSTRRNGKSLGQMAREEIGLMGGVLAFLAVLSIVTILLAVVALIVVNALKGSPWGTFTIACTIPIAMLMGVYLRWLRPGRVFEASTLGFLLVIAAVVGGEWVAASPTWAGFFTFSAMTLAIMIMVYGFAASTLPVWLLLAPRDYLSAFLKLGTIAGLAVAIVIARPELQMPALTRFVDGTGPIFAGKVFPFAFITIACGALSGFHSLISSGTTPKLLRREPDARMVGYGAMLCESFVAIMAMIAACVLQPGIYFAVNSPAGLVGTTAAAATQTITAWGFPVTVAEMQTLATDMGEETLFNRTGGAPSLAIGMAYIFSSSFGGRALMSIWYHFAIMFEAMFILTILDAGTRVVRFLLQDMLGHLYKPAGRTSWYPGVIFTSALIVAMWGYFLIQGVQDPLGGINSLWPLFGIGNQLLAAVALCLATTILIKTKRIRYALVTLLPLVWLVTVTFSAGYAKVFDPNPRIGFLAHASQTTVELEVGVPTAAEAHRMQQIIFNDRLDAVVALVFMALVFILLTSSAVDWIRILLGRKTPTLHEAPFQLSALAAEEGD